MWKKLIMARENNLQNRLNTLCEDYDLLVLDIGVNVDALLGVDKESLVVISTTRNASCSMKNDLKKLKVLSQKIEKLNKSINALKGYLR